MFQSLRWRLQMSVKTATPFSRQLTPRKLTLGTETGKRVYNPTYGVWILSDQLLQQHNKQIPHPTGSLPLSQHQSTDDWQFSCHRYPARAVRLLDLWQRFVKTRQGKTRQWRKRIRALAPLSVFLLHTKRITWFWCENGRDFASEGSTDWSICQRNVYG